MNDDGHDGNHADECPDCIKAHESGVRACENCEDGTGHLGGWETER